MKLAGSRARLLTKRKVLRHLGHPLRARRGLRDLARDPEVDSFTYRIVDEDDLAAVLADLTGDPLQTMAALFREAPGSLAPGRPDMTGPSREVLPRFLPEWDRIDLFINDSAAGRN